MDTNDKHPGGRTDWKRLEKMEDADIDFSDDPEADDEFWENAEWGILANKTLLSVRFDTDIIEWFKSQGRGYQTRMNAVLRSYMQSMRRRASKPSGTSTPAPPKGRAVSSPVKRTPEKTAGKPATRSAKRIVGKATARVVTRSAKRAPGKPVGKTVTGSAKRTPGKAVDKAVTRSVKRTSGKAIGKAARKPVNRKK